MDNPPNEPQVESGATTANPPQPDLLSKIERASDRAVDGFAATAKRKPGQRGPDKGPRRKKVPVDFMAEGSDAPLLEESQGDDNPFVGLDAPGLDEETAQALADVVFELFKDGRANFCRMKVLQITGDKDLADAFITPISEKLESAMRKSAKLCVIKYGANIEHAPEITFLGAAAIIVVGDFMRLRMLNRDVAKARQAA